MSENDQKPGKILRTSSGKTRLTASGDGDAPAAPVDRPSDSKPAGTRPGSAGQAVGGADQAPSRATEDVFAQEGPDSGWTPPSEGSGSQPRRVSSASKGMRLTAGGDDQAPQGSGPNATVMSPAVGSGPAGLAQPAGSGVGSAPTGAARASSGGVKMSGKSKRKGPRTVRLTIANIDPWSVMKMSFLLSLAIAIAMLVATLVLWLVLQATGVMGTIESTLSEIAGEESADELLALFSLGRVMATAFVLALVNIVLMTALSTLFAFLYNIGASIVGGFHLTLTDD